MKISVIVPCYNAQRYLEECVASVLAQTMGDFELLLIDDGSKDETLALCSRLAGQDERIRIFHQENAGVSAARNLGLEHARGEWVTFVDADDLLVSDAFERMLGAAREDVDLVAAMHETFDDTGARETVYPVTRWMDRQGEDCRRAAALRLIEGDSVLNIMCNKLHRRAVIERECLRLETGVRIAEDALFNLEAVLCGRGIAFAGHVTYRYRMHAQSATHSVSQGAFDTHLPWFYAMRAMLERRGVIGAYYPAFFDSVVLRLYKDGGVLGVMRNFDKAKLILTDVPKDDLRRTGRILRALAQKGLYPIVYPLIFPVQLIRRKGMEAAFALRLRKEKRH